MYLGVSQIFSRVPQLMHLMKGESSLLRLLTPAVMHMFIPVSESAMPWYYQFSIFFFQAVCTQKPFLSWHSDDSVEALRLFAFCLCIFDLLTAGNM